MIQLKAHTEHASSTVTVQRESSAALGQGCRLGFLGTLHMSVLVQRLNDEYGADVCVTAPTVPYKSQYFMCDTI